MLDPTYLGGVFLHEGVAAVTVLELGEEAAGHLRRAAEVLRDHYQVHQRLCVVAVLWQGNDK